MTPDLSPGESGSEKISAANPFAPVSFRQWTERLGAAALDPTTKESHRRAILGFRKRGKTLHRPASIGFAKEYLADLQAQGNVGTAAVNGLRWFFQSARREPLTATDGAPLRNSPVSPGRVTLNRNEPSPGNSDLGREEWEQALVRAARTRGFGHKKAQRGTKKYHGNCGFEPRSLRTVPIVSFRASSWQKIRGLVATASVVGPGSATPARIGA